MIQTYSDQQAAIDKLSIELNNSQTRVLQLDNNMPSELVDLNQNDIRRSNITAQEALDAMMQVSITGDAKSALLELSEAFTQYMDAQEDLLKISMDNSKETSRNDLILSYRIVNTKIYIFSSLCRNVVNSEIAPI